MTTSMIRIALADDHPLIRSGIRTTLSSEPDIEVVGEAASGDEVVPLCQKHRPDVLLLDLSMPGPPTAKTLQDLQTHCPDVRVVILSAYDDDVYVRATMAVGVAGYILKDEATDSLVTAIRTICQGATWFSRPVLDKVLHWKAGDDVLADLTEREHEILMCLARGWDNTRIATSMHLAEQTVRNYTSRIYSKIGVASRVEAVLWSRANGLIRD